MPPVIVETLKQLRPKRRARSGSENATVSVVSVLMPRKRTYMAHGRPPSWQGSKKLAIEQRGMQKAGASCVQQSNPHMAHLA